MSQAILPVLMRYVHILSAIAAMGSIFFMAVCARPATRLIEGGLRDSVNHLMEKRMNRLLWIAIGGFLISGGYNWVASAGTYKAMGPMGNALIGVKVMLALAMFAVVMARSFGAIKAKPAGMINLHLGAIIILLATIIRYLRLEHIHAAVGGG